MCVDCGKLINCKYEEVKINSDSGISTMGETFAERLANGICVKCFGDDVTCEKDCTLHTCIDCNYVQEKSLEPACYDMDLIGKESLINAYLGLNTNCNGEEIEE